MRKILIILILSINFNGYLNASNFEKKEIYFKFIEKECKNLNSQYHKYYEIGMKQFAKNYLKICLEEKLNRFLKINYQKCLQSKNQEYCQRKIKLWLEN